MNPPSRGFALGRLEAILVGVEAHAKAAGTPVAREVMCGAGDERVLAERVRPTDDSASISVIQGNHAPVPGGTSLHQRQKSKFGFT
jgi:hypothetical protein